MNERVEEVITTFDNGIESLAPAVALGFVPFDKAYDLIGAFLCGVAAALTKEEWQEFVDNSEIAREYAKIIG